jgi:hypothetical protein
VETAPWMPETLAYPSHYSLVASFLLAGSWAAVVVAFEDASRQPCLQAVRDRVKTKAWGHFEYTCSCTFTDDDSL